MGKSTMQDLINIARFISTHPLTRNARLKAWARFFSWQIRSRIQEETIVPWFAGQRIVGRKGMTGLTGSIYAGLGEFEEMMLALHFLRKRDLFLDIGANVGSYAILASGVCGATTWAFEPDPNTVRSLERNVAVNNLEELVTVHELALGDSDADVAFTVGKDTANRVATTGERNVRIVRQQRLDALIGGAPYPIIMMKIDVEGYGEEVLRGAKVLVHNDCLKIIVIEWPTDATHEALSRHNFTRVSYEPFSRKLEQRPSTSSSDNVVYVRDWDFVNFRVMAANHINILGQSI
jgi:FkbM family methyltransferase